MLIWNIYNINGAVSANGVLSDDIDPNKHLIKKKKKKKIKLCVRARTDKNKRKVKMVLNK